MNFDVTEKPARTHSSKGGGKRLMYYNVYVIIKV